MLLARGMQLSRPLRRPRPRLVTALGCAALLTATAACSATEHLTTGMKVRGAVVKLGEQPSSSVTASVDGSTRQAYEFLRRTRGDAATHKDAQRLARAELTLAAGSGSEETPLKEMRGSDATDVAAALNFGGRDVAAVKSVGDKLYLRVSLHSLVRQTGGSHRARETAKEIVALADDLPPSLGAARDALQGKWVRADPEAFDDFARTGERLAERGSERAAAARRAQDAKKRSPEKKRSQEKRTPAGKTSDGEKSGEKKRDGAREKKRAEAAHEAAAKRAQAEKYREVRDAVTIGSALDGQSQREFVTSFQRLLAKHATFSDGGERNGADHVRLTLPGRESARDLVAALKPLGAEVDPDRVPDGDITADLALRRGQLTALTLDLGQFAGHGSHLPLRVDFGGGNALSVTDPGGTKELKPQDLLAAVMYGALGTRNF